jgi:hypothetical protein
VTCTKPLLTSLLSTLDVIQMPETYNRCMFPRTPSPVERRYSPTPEAKSHARRRVPPPQRRGQSPALQHTDLPHNACGSQSKRDSGAMRQSFVRPVEAISQRDFAPSCPSRAGATQFLSGATVIPRVAVMPAEPLLLQWRLPSEEDCAQPALCFQQCVLGHSQQSVWQVELAGPAASFTSPAEPAQATYGFISKLEDREAHTDLSSSPLSPGTSAGNLPASECSPRRRHSAEQLPLVTMAVAGPSPLPSSMGGGGGGGPTSEHAAQPPSARPLALSCYEIRQKMEKQASQ